MPESLVLNRTATPSSTGGMRVAGNLGEMGLTSMGGDVFRYYWETNSFGQISVIKGLGTNRMSIESNGDMVLIAKSGVYEFEGLSGLITASTVEFHGFEAISSRGRPINFTNRRHVDAKVTPAIATNCHAEVADTFEWRKQDGNDVETIEVVAKVGRDGDFEARSYKGMLTTETEAEVGTITPTHTLILYDAAGNAFRVPAELVSPA